MISVKNNTEGKFVIYKTSLRELPEEFKLYLQVALNDKEIELNDVSVVRLYNSYLFFYPAYELDTDTQYKLLIKNNDEEIIYTEKAYVF